MKITGRKVAAFVGASALALASLAGCSNSTDTSSSDSDADKSKGGGKVTLSLSTQTNPFFIQLRDGATGKAKELGIELSVVDASDDAATQADQLSNAMQSGTQVVIVNPVDSDAVGPSVEALNKAKIPVVAVDRAANSGTVDSFIASDNIAGGEQAAEMLAKAIGEEGEIIVLQGTAGTSASRERGEGFEKGIAKFPKVKVVAKQTAEFDRAKGLDVATNLLQSNPNVKGIFAENDEMALGAIEALGDRAGKDVFVVGFDGTEDGLAAIEKGTMVGTIAQQPGVLGSTAVEMAAKILSGEKPEKNVPVSVVSVTKDNVAEYK